MPGVELLPKLLHDFEADTGVPCRLQVDGDPASLPPDVQLATYRVAQEALTNVRRHGSSSLVVLSVSSDSSEARLTIEDSGDEAPAAMDGANGHGLAGMRERAELLGGELVAAPTETGFRVSMKVPL